MLCWRQQWEKREDADGLNLDVYKVNEPASVNLGPLYSKRSGPFNFLSLELYFLASPSWKPATEKWFLPSEKYFLASPISFLAPPVYFLAPPISFLAPPVYFLASPISFLAPPVWFLALEKVKLPPAICNHVFYSKNKNRKKA